jgi:hypothetical protein
MKVMISKYLDEMRILLTVAFLFMTVYSYSQDKIRTLSGEVINANVLEISKDDVSYKKSSNPDGPVYILKKKEINSIIYQNGETEVFNNDRSYREGEKNADAEPDSRVVELFYTMTRRNNRVYITGENENAVVHAKNAISRWGYWVVTEKKYNADFILNFNVNFEGAEAYGSADFIYPRNGKTVRSTPELYANATDDLNIKRGLINKIINNGIKPMFYK